MPIEQAFIPSSYLLGAEQAVLARLVAACSMLGLSDVQVRPYAGELAVDENGYVDVENALARGPVIFVAFNGRQHAQASSAYGTRAETISYTCYLCARSLRSETEQVRSTYNLSEAFDLAFAGSSASTDIAIDHDMRPEALEAKKYVQQGLQVMLVTPDAAILAGGVELQILRSIDGLQTL